MVAYKKLTKIIMKITFPHIVLLCLAFTKQAHACSCSNYWNTKEKIESANYVALVKVIDIVSANSPKHHKIKVTEQILYKGKSVIEIIVAGGNRALDSTKWSSCDLSIEKGEEWIIYGHKKGDDIEIGFCSDPMLYKNKDGCRDVNLGFNIKELNEVNSYFSKPLLTFTQKKGTLKLYYPNGKKEATIQFKNGLKYGLTPQQEYDHIKTFVRNTNKRLTRVGIELGLSLKVTIYVARHCFATIQKNNNAPLAYTSEA